MSRVFAPIAKKTLKSISWICRHIKQVKDHEFEELQTRLGLENEKIAIKLAEANIKTLFQDQLSKERSRATRRKSKSNWHYLKS
jgi:hypothetical protein